VSLPPLGARLRAAAYLDVLIDATPPLRLALSVESERARFAEAAGRALAASPAEALAALRLLTGRAFVEQLELGEAGRAALLAAIEAPRRARAAEGDDAARALCPELLVALPTARAEAPLLALLGAPAPAVARATLAQLDARQASARLVTAVAQIASGP